MPADRHLEVGDRSTFHITRRGGVLGPETGLASPRAHADENADQHAHEHNHRTDGDCFPPMRHSRERTACRGRPTDRRLGSRVGPAGQGDMTWDARRRDDRSRRRAPAALASADDRVKRLRVSAKRVPAVATCACMREGLLAWRGHSRILPVRQMTLPRAGADSNSVYRRGGSVRGTFPRAAADCGSVDAPGDAQSRSETRCARFGHPSPKQIT